MTGPGREPNAWSGPLFILAAAGLWSAAGIGIKSLGLPAMATVGYRSMFALPVVVLLGRDAWKLSLLRKPVVAGTSVAYLFTIGLFVSATTLTTAANAILLQYTSPVWIILLSYPLLREKPHTRDVVVAAVCLAGLALFFLDHLTPEGRLGMVFAILSGLAMALLFMGFRHEGLRGTQSASGVVMVAGNLLCVAAGMPHMIQTFGGMRARQWAILALLGVFQLGLSYVLFSAGVRRVPALRATLLGLIEPVLNPVWVAIGTGEIPGSGAIAGGLIVLACLAADTLVPRNPDSAPPV
jgi:drug/metabolite transporter, DME family